MPIFCRTKVKTAFKMLLFAMNYFLCLMAQKLVSIFPFVVKKAKVYLLAIRALTTYAVLRHGR